MFKKNHIKYNDIPIFKINEYYFLKNKNFEKLKLK